MALDESQRRRKSHRFDQNCVRARPSIVQAPPPAQRLQPFLPPPHLNVIQMRCHPGADARRRAMEIAAVLMFAAAVMGFVQQFDNPSW